MACDVSEHADVVLDRPRWIKYLPNPVRTDAHGVVIGSAFSEVVVRFEGPLTDRSDLSTRALFGRQVALETHMQVKELEEQGVTDD